MEPLSISDILQNAWNRFKFLYEDAKKCDFDYQKSGTKRDAKDYTYVPWSELDAQFMFANLIEEQYESNGSKAEIHHSWDVRNWFGLTIEEKASLAQSFPKARKFDMFVSSPYARLVGEDKQAFDAIIEFKMYRSSWDRTAWDVLKPQLESLVEVKRTKWAKEAAAVLINRGVLNPVQWDSLLANSKVFERSGVKIFHYDAGPY